MFRKCYPKRWRRLPHRPQLETLEQRLAPATHTWTGAVGILWSTAGNWVGGPPLAGEANVVLSYPTSPIRANCSNDIPNLAIQEMDFNGGGYSLGGDALTLLGNATVNDSAPGSNAISIALNLAGCAAAPADHVFDVASGATLLLNGVASGPGSFSKAGGGTLILAAVNRYTGTTSVQAGTLAQGIDNAYPVGPVFVAAGATLSFGGHNASSAP